MKTIAPDSHLTSGQVAKMLRVAPRTVSKWFNSGLFPGAYVLPKCDGGVYAGERRIPTAALRVFCERFNIPVPPEVLLATRPPTVYAGAVPDSGPFVAAVVASAPAAGTWSGGLVELIAQATIERPDAVLLGTTEGLDLAVRVATVLLGFDPVPNVAVVLADDSDPWDERLSPVRSRLVWLGIMPNSWQEAVTLLLTRKESDAPKKRYPTQNGRPRRDAHPRNAGVELLPGEPLGP